MNFISSNLKILRHEANLSFEELSDKTGIKKELIEGFESGIYLPNEYQLEILCKVLKMPVDEIADRNLSEERKLATQHMRSKGNRENYNWYFGNKKRFLFFLGYVIYFFLGITLLAYYYVNKFEKAEITKELLQFYWNENPSQVIYFLIDFFRIGFSLFGLGISTFMLIDYFSRHQFYFQWWYLFWLSIIITCLELIGIFGSIPYLIYVIIRLVKGRY